MEIRSERKEMEFEYYQCIHSQKHPIELNLPSCGIKDMSFLQRIELK